jgi:N-acetylmuramoyl-L-alanine amidase
MEEREAMRIALDAGHGASRGLSHTGCAANGLVEDELALDFIKRIGHHLREAGYDTVIIRPDARLVALATRGKRAIDGHCDLFLSIHVNAGPASAQGVEAYVAEGDSLSRDIAQRLVDGVSKHGLRNRGAKWDSQSQYSRLRVLRDTHRHMPAVLLEIGFLTNVHDARLLADKHFREAVAVGIAMETSSNVRWRS